MSWSKFAECQERKKKTKETTDVFGIIQYFTFDRAVFEIKQTCFGGRSSCCMWAKHREPMSLAVRRNCSKLMGQRLRLACVWAQTGSVFPNCFLWMDTSPASKNSVLVFIVNTGGKCLNNKLFQM